MKRSTALILFLFTLSGVSGLIYEITWIRLLSHLLGGTSFAISTVLAAFMGGLAAGSRYFGARADHSTGLLKLYGRLEFGIAALGGLSYLIIRLAMPGYAALAQSLPDGAVVVLRVVIAMLLILPPTFLMGGTLPILSRFLVRESSHLGRGLGLLYAVNTFGAVVGCFLTGFVLIATLGLPGSVILAVILNIAIGIGVLGIARRLSTDDQATSPRPETDEAGSAATTGAKYSIDFGLLGAMFACSGFASLGYELYWTRALQHFLGNSTYAFSAMLTTFLLGLAAGGWTGGRLADRSSRPDALLGWIQIGIGATCLGTVLIIWGWLPGLGESNFLNDHQLGWNTYLMRRFLVAFAVMALPTLLIGMTFPIVSRIGIREMSRLGHGVGTLYFLNTLGSILGSLAAGFLILPLLAAKGALVATAILSGLIGLAVHWGSRKRDSQQHWAAGLALLALLAISPLVLGFGAAPLSDTQSATDRVLFQMEDYAAETRVYSKTNGELHMSVDGHHIGGTETSILRKEKILAHLPMSLRPDARKTLSVGLGSGITLGTLALYDDLETLDCVEIVPGVVEGARCFDTANGNVLDDERVRMHVGDGVQFLLTSAERYDVISSDSKLNPEYSGNAPLLSRDYYELCRDRLSDNGVMVQWLASHQPLGEMEIICRSFIDAFPHVAVYWYDPYNLILAGSRLPLIMDMGAMRRKMDAHPDLRNDLESLQLDDPYAMAALYLADRDRLQEIVGDGPRNTWDRPRLEFTMLREFRRKNQSAHEVDNLRWMKRLRNPATMNCTELTDPARLERFVDSSRAVLEGFLAAGGLRHLTQGRETWQHGLEANPDDRRLAALITRSTTRDAELEQAAAAGRVNDVDNLVALALTRQNHQQYAEALALLERARIMKPHDASILYNRLLVLKELGHTEELGPEISDFQKLFPRDARGHSLAGRMAAEAGRFVDAVDRFRQAIDYDPVNPVYLNNLATTLARLERYGEAADVYVRVCDIQMDFPGAAYYAAACFSMAERLEESARWMNFCLEHDLATREHFTDSSYFATLRSSTNWPD